MSETEPVQDEFDTMARWTADAVAEVGPGAGLPAGCRGSGTPEALRWLARTMGLRDGMTLVDSGAGVGGPSELAAREFAVSPVLTDPMRGACAAAARIFGRPTAVADGGRLPFGAAAFDAAWSIGVLCTVEDKAPVLAELRRVVGTGSPVGFLVFVRTRASLPEQPEGNHFPSLQELTALIEAAGLSAIDQAALADFPEPPEEWQDLADRVDAVTERDHGEDERFRTAQEQSAAIGSLLADGLVEGRLLVARA
ncbi:MAG: methyltransferase domain-containing protein [Nocardioidaceae bacterium]